MDTRQHHDDDARRFALYQWFSSVLAQEQNRESWAAHASAAFREELQAYAARPGLEEGAREVLDFVESNPEGEDGSVRMALAVDYAQLFIGPGPGHAPPFESVYTSPEKRLYADAYADVIDFLHDEDIAVAKEFKAPADHVAVELAVMAHLIERTADEADSAARETGSLRLTDRQASFLESHVLNWMPRFCDDLTTHAETGFYRGVGRMLAGFLTEERERLEAHASI